VKPRARSVGLFALAIVLVVICDRTSQAQEPAPPATSTTSQKPATAIFVANPTLDSLSVFPLGSNGNVPSLFTRTFLAQPSGIAYWKGNLYVTNIGGTGGYSVTAYPVSGGRRPAPLFSIGAQLIIPQGVALDSAGNIYVVNEGIESGDQRSDPPSVTIYRAGSNGDDEPMARISGPKTRLSYSQALALDSQGYIYVSNQGYVSNENPKGEPPTITVYAPGSNGNVAPVRVISGPATLLSAPEGIAVDSSGRLFVSSSAPGAPQGAAVLIFAPGSSGNVAPFASIDCDCAKIHTPGAITLGSNGTVYVTTRWNFDTGTAGVAAFTQQDQEPAEHLNLEPIVTHHPTGPPTIEGYTGQCLTPILSISGKKTGISHPGGIAVDPDGNMYVTNDDSNSIGVFKAGANGNVVPSVTIESPTSISSPSSVAVDSNGQIYVANGSGQGDPRDESASITVYPPGSYANVAEIATISADGFEDTPGDGLNDKPGLTFAEAIAVDTHGKIYVADTGGRGAGDISNGRIAIFSAGSKGNVAPIATIVGTKTIDNTGLNDPVGLAINSGGDIYVLNSNGGSDNSGSITVYPADANGNVAPKAIIANEAKDKRTQFHQPTGMALDSAGDIYVTNNSNDTVTIYAAGKFGDVAPKATISGPDTGLNQPHGIGIDSDGKIYVSNDGSDNKGADTVTVYAAGSSGDAKPIAIVSGSLTGLGKPGGLAVGP
jgi:sugar lactone lactonase YvrE